MCYHHRKQGAAGLLIFRRRWLKLSAWTKALSSFFFRMDAFTCVAYCTKITRVRSKAMAAKNTSAKSKKGSSQHRQTARLTRFWGADEALQMDSGNGKRDEHPVHLNPETEE